jgi:predicted Zn-dependent protease
MTLSNTMSAQSDSRFLTREQCEELARRAASFATGGGRTELRIDSQWMGNVRWARNQVISSGDSRDTQVLVQRNIRGATSITILNEIDDASLHAAIQRTEKLIQLAGERPETGQNVLPLEEYLQPKIWSDATYNLDPQERAAAMRVSIKGAESAQVQSAGYVQVLAAGQAFIDSTGRSLYYPFTKAQYSVTVRDPAAKASGWAGMDHTDWARIDVQKLATTALEKCLRSRNPAFVEPGRYTTILEPQAVCDFFNPVMTMLDRNAAESQGGWGPFSRRNGTSRIGEKIFDERISVTADPMDPDLGFVPFDYSGQAYRPATWFQNGVLVNLAYDRRYAIQKLGHDTGLLNSGAYRISGGSTSIDEMIATTRRGLIVTRFSNVSIVDYTSMLLSGYTRDGVWLIENGKMSKPVRNFRFSESPLFAFNNIEQIGSAVRVFNPVNPVVVPALKIREFSFIGIADAV